MTWSPQTASILGRSLLRPRSATDLVAGTVVALALAIACVHLLRRLWIWQHTIKRPVPRIGALRATVTHVSTARVCESPPDKQQASPRRGHGLDAAVAGGAPAPSALRSTQQATSRLKKEASVAWADEVEDLVEKSLASAAAQARVAASPASSWLQRRSSSMPSASQGVALHPSPFGLDSSVSHPSTPGFTCVPLPPAPHPHQLAADDNPTTTEQPDAKKSRHRLRPKQQPAKRRVGRANESASDHGVGKKHTRVVSSHRPSSREPLARELVAAPQSQTGQKPDAAASLKAPVSLGLPSTGGKRRPRQPETGDPVKDDEREAAEELYQETWALALGCAGPARRVHRNESRLVAANAGDSDGGSDTMSGEEGGALRKKDKHRVAPAPARGLGIFAGDGARGPPRPAASSSSDSLDFSAIEKPLKLHGAQSLAPPPPSSAPLPPARAQPKSRYSDDAEERDAINAALSAALQKKP